MEEIMFVALLTCFLLPVGYDLPAGAAAVTTCCAVDLTGPDPSSSVASECVQLRGHPLASQARSAGIPALACSRFFCPRPRSRPWQSSSPRHFHRSSPHRVVGVVEAGAGVFA